MKPNLRDRGRVLALVAGLSFLAPAACSRGGNAVQYSGEATSVKVADARVETLEDRVSGIGNVVPSLAADWTVFAPEAAEIREITKIEGDPVKAGDIIIKFDIPSVTSQVASAQTSVAEATSALDAAKAEMAKIAGLIDRGYVARETVDAAQNALVDGRSRLARADAELEIAKSRLKEGEVRARFDGVVLKRWHNDGDLVLSGDTDPIIRIIDPARVQVTLPLSMADLTRVTTGLVGTVSNPGMPGDPVPATVVGRPVSIDAGATTADIRLSFSAPTTLTLDTAVDVQIVLERHPDVLAVPRTAVQKDDDGAFVMIAGDDGFAHRRGITTGFSTQARIQVLTGVTAGEKVITTGLDQIAEGSPITIER